MSRAEDMLAKAEADLERFVNRPQYGGHREFDHGMLNVPQSQRGDIDADLRKWRKLNDRIAYWEGKVRAERSRASKPERDAAKAAKARAHAAMDLRARYSGCTEVRWSLSGGWLTVVRWNRKSVTVDMAGARESIPHDQIADAR